MTTNKPTTYWAPSTALHKLESRHNNAPCILTDGPAEFNDVALVRLADYERLQAELERERKRRFDGNEQASREHREDMKALVEALVAILEHDSPINIVDTATATERDTFDIARAALAAHRKQEGDV